MIDAAIPNPQATFASALIFQPMSSNIFVSPLLYFIDLMLIIIQKCIWIIAHKISMFNNKKYYQLFNINKNFTNDDFVIVIVTS